MFGSASFAPWRRTSLAAQFSGMRGPNTLRTGAVAHGICVPLKFRMIR